MKPKIDFEIERDPREELERGIYRLNNAFSRKHIGQALAKSFMEGLDVEIRYSDEKYLLIASITDGQQMYTHSFTQEFLEYNI